MDDRAARIIVLVFELVLVVLGFLGFRMATRSGDTSPPVVTVPVPQTIPAPVPTRRPRLPLPPLREGSDHEGRNDSPSDSGADSSGPPR